MCDRPFCVCNNKFVTFDCRDIVGFECGAFVHTYVCQECVSYSAGVASDSNNIFVRVFDNLMEYAL